METPLLTQICANWIDKNGFVKPQASWDDSGNGLLYSSVLIVLLKELGEYTGQGVRLWWTDLVISCQIERGLYKRAPNNSFQEQWDDYLGIVAASTALGITTYPRDILKYGLLHAFFFDTDRNLEWKDFLGRFVSLWVVCWASAYSFLKWPLYPILWFVGKTMKPDLNDTSGLQLQWLYYNTCKNFGFRFSQYDELLKLLPAAFNIYYDPNHPFITAALEIKGGSK